MKHRTRATDDDALLASGFALAELFDAYDRVVGAHVKLIDIYDSLSDPYGIGRHVQGAASARGRQDITLELLIDFGRWQRETRPSTDAV